MYYKFPLYILTMKVIIYAQGMCVYDKLIQYNSLQYLDTLIIYQRRRELLPEAGAVGVLGLNHTRFFRCRRRLDRC